MLSAVRRRLPRAVACTRVGSAGEAAVLEEARTTTEFRLLGPFEALREGVPLELGGLKQRALLALLLLNANEVVSRDRLIEDLWGEHPPKDAPHTVQVFVSRLRKSLGSGVIETRAPGYAVRTDVDELDLARFERLHALGRDELERGRAAAAHRAFGEALSLFRGAPLADFNYEPWAEREVNRLEEARLSCLEERIAAELALGRHGSVLVELEHLVAENPFREQLRGYFMLALYRSGRQADALESYNEARADLDSELGIEPSAELKTLHRRILNQDATLDVEQLPPRPPTNLPSPPTPLLGRERELRELIEVVRRPDARLVTLTGPGGTGKTRLALEAAAQLTDDFEDGVFFVPLAAVREPRFVAPAIAQAVGLGDVGETAGESLAAYVAGRSILFLIDNFEQVVDAAMDLTPMLGAGDSVRLVVTSREPLRLAAERVFPVTSLAVPPVEAVTDAAELRSFPATELFLARAASAGGTTTLSLEEARAVAGICSQLDGLPLAIELAAARTNVFSPTAILNRLHQKLTLLTSATRDADERHRTLRAAIQWSHELLSEEEKTIFATLSVFAGGGRLEVVAQVCDPTPGGDHDVLEVLSALVDKSLLRRFDDRDGEPRFSMLETIREYAEERLEESGTAPELHGRFFHWALALAEEVEFGSRQHQWMQRVQAEHENVRAALRVAPVSRRRAPARIRSRRVLDLGRTCSRGTSRGRCPPRSGPGGARRRSSEGESRCRRARDLPR